MIVYRVIEDVYAYTKDGNHRNEYQDYLKGVISLPKESFNDGINTHDYKIGVKYLHFFHFYEGAIEYVSGISSMICGGRCYIASYDIPDELLGKYRGMGIYPESIHPAVPLLEYAIPYDELSNSFIVGEARRCNLRDEFSEEYKNYMLSEYKKYIESLDDNNKKFIKAYFNRDKRWVAILIFFYEVLWQVTYI